jgi:hypothetical protein
MIDILGIHIYISLELRDRETRGITKYCTAMDVLIIQQNSQNSGRTAPNHHDSFTNLKPDSTLNTKN